MPLPAFKAYDIRGRVPEELNEDLARRIGVPWRRSLRRARWCWAMTCA
jgi:phosphomannomutase